MSFWCCAFLKFLLSNQRLKRTTLWVSCSNQTDPGLTPPWCPGLLARPTRWHSFPQTPKPWGYPGSTSWSYSASSLKALMCAGTALCTTIPTRLYPQMHTDSSDKQQRNTYNIKTSSAKTLLICTQLPSGMPGETARTEEAHTASTGLYHNSWSILLTDELVTGATQCRKLLHTL